MLLLVARALASFVWLIAVGCFGLLWALVRFKDPNADHYFARLYSRVQLWILGIDVEVQDEALISQAQPGVIVANHQSGIDMATFGKLYPRRTIVIGKKELLWIPVFGVFFWASGNILLNRQRHRRAVAGIQQAVDALRDRGLSIWIFPEGTRNRAETGLLPFKKGAFHMAIAAQRPIIPIVCSELKPVFSWNEKRLAFRGRVQIRVLPAIPTQGLTSADVDALSARVRETMLAALMTLRSEVRV